MSAHVHQLTGERPKKYWIFALTGVLLIGGFFLVQEIREYLFASHIRNVLLRKGAWEFSCPSFEDRTLEVDLTAVAESIRIRSLYSESGEVAWSCADAIAIRRVGSSDPWMTFCWDEMLQGDGNSTWTIEFVDDAAYRNLVKVSPWTQEEYEASLPGLWENIHGQ